MRVHGQYQLRCAIGASAAAHFVHTRPPDPPLGPRSVAVLGLEDSVGHGQTLEDGRQGPDGGADRLQQTSI